MKRKEPVDYCERLKPLRRGQFVDDDAVEHTCELYDVDANHIATVVAEDGGVWQMHVSRVKHVIGIVATVLVVVAAIAWHYVWTRNE